MWLAYASGVSRRNFQNEGLVASFGFGDSFGGVFLARSAASTYGFSRHYSRFAESPLLRSRVSFAGSF